MSGFSRGLFDSETMAKMIAEWAAVESPSFDVEAVKRMMDQAETSILRLGALPWGPAVVTS